MKLYRLTNAILYTTLIVIIIILLLNIYPKIVLGGDAEAFMIFPDIFLTKSIYMRFEYNAYGSHMSIFQNFPIYFIFNIIGNFFEYKVLNYILYIGSACLTFLGYYKLVKSYDKYENQNNIQSNRSMYMYIIIGLLGTFNLRSGFYFFRGIHTEYISGFIIPFIVSGYINYINNNSKSILYTMLFLFIWGNPGHAIVLYIMLFIFFVYYTVLGSKNITLVRLIKKSIIYIGTSVVISFAIILSYYQGFKGSYDLLKNNEINLNQVINGEIIQQSKYQNILSTFGNLNQTYITPGAHGMPIVDYNKYGYIYMLSLLVFIIGIFLTRKSKKYIFRFLVYLLLVFILTGAGGVYGKYFEYFVLHIPGGGIFRAVYSKFNYVMIIAQLVMLYYIFTAKYKNNNIRMYVIAIIFIVPCIGFFGRFFDPIYSQTNIPQGYLLSIDTFNKIGKNNHFARGILLPKTNLQRGSFTKRGFWGYSLFQQSSTFPFLDMGTAGFSLGGEKIYNKVINSSDYLDIKKLNYYNINFIVYQKDFNYNYTDYYKFPDQEKEIKHFIASNSGKLEKVQTNEYFDVYKIKESDKSMINSSQFSKINPTQYHLSIKGIKNSQDLSFLQSFHPERKLYPGKAITNCQSTQFYNSYTESGSYHTGINHTVLPGETIYSIAQQYNSGNWRKESDHIYDLNNLSGAKLLEGQILQIRPEAYPEMIQIATGNITECIQAGYKFYEGAELSYLQKQPLRDENHKMIYDYANARDINIYDNYPGSHETYLAKGLREGWISENSDDTYDINLVLYFRPQSWFYLGLGISGVTFLGLLIWLVVAYRRDKNSLEIKE